MKTFLLFLLALLVIFIAYEAVRVLYLMRVSKRLIAEHAAFSMHPVDVDRKILIIGDSLEAGVGAKPGESIAERIHADFPKADITNLARSGARIEDALRQANSLSDNEKFDTVIVQIGANDIVHGSDLEEAKSNLKELLQKTKTHTRKVVYMTSGNVGFAPLFPPLVSKYFESRSVTFIGAFKDIAEVEDATYIDFLFSREDDPFLKDPQRFYAADKFHPSGDGYVLWYAKLKGVL